ncbi:MAG: hypothetical protein K8T90_03760 [Planctomycetes bacterium]|nr:hypothetical protein [Planctomycetota bacterium]
MRDANRRDPPDVARAVDSRPWRRLLAAAACFVAGACGPDSPDSTNPPGVPGPPRSQSSVDAVPAAARPDRNVSAAAVAARVAGNAVPFRLPPLTEHAGGHPFAGTAVDVWVVVADESAPGRRSVIGPVTVTSDADGVATVGVPDVNSVIRWTARAGERWWRSGLEPPDAPTLAPGFGDRTLVRVVDHTGVGVAGVRVSLVAADGQVRSHVGDTPYLNFTDADGLVLVSRPGARLQRGGPPLPAPATVVQVELPIVPQVAAPLPPEGPGPFVLRLPPTGAVRVRVVGSGVEAGLADSAVVALNPLMEGSHATGFTPSASARVVDGVAEFPHVGVGVGVGLRFAASLTPGPKEVTTRVEFQGPAAPGRPIAIDLPLGGLRPVFAGRLLTEDGAPQARGFVTIYVAATSDASPWMPQASTTATTSDDGSFRATIDLAAERLSGAEITVEAAQVMRRRADAVAPGGTVNLGDIRPEARPLVVSGRVTDDAGKPVAGALMQVYASGGSLALPQRDLQAYTAEDGTFTIRGTPASPSPFDVRLGYHQSVMAAPVAFERGATDVTVRGARAGTAFVRIVLPKGLAEGAIWPEFEGEPTLAAYPPVRGRSRAAGMMFGNGTYSFERLTPGVGSIVVRAPGDDATAIARIDDVEITAAGRTDAGTIDLSKVVPVATVRVTDAAGKPAIDAGVWWTADRGDAFAQWQQIAADADGAARVPVLRPIRVLARRQGSRFAEARRVTGNATLRTEPAREIPVTVRLADGIELPAAPFRFQIALGRLDDDAPATSIPNPSDPRNNGRPPIQLAGGARSATVFVTEPGRWRAVLSLMHDRGGGANGATVPHQGENVVTVGEDGEPCEVVVRAEPGEIEALRVRILRE